MGEVGFFFPFLFTSPSPPTPQDQQLSFLFSPFYCAFLDGAFQSMRKFFADLASTF